MTDLAYLKTAVGFPIDCGSQSVTKRPALQALTVDSRYAPSCTMIYHLLLLVRW